ncbi:MAG: hypothetical protein WCF79_00595 [Rhodomicrobium sp.]
MDGIAPPAPQCFPLASGINFLSQNIFNGLLRVPVNEIKIWYFQRFTGNHCGQIEGAALLLPSPSKLLFNQFMTGNYSRGASINHVCLNARRGDNPFTFGPSLFAVARPLLDFAVSSRKRRGRYPGSLQMPALFAIPDRA